MKIFLDANICLDLLDTTRPTSEDSKNGIFTIKTMKNLSFIFQGILSQLFTTYLLKKENMMQKTLQAIDMLCNEINPHYITHIDFKNAKVYFFNDVFEDFEDLLILQSATRIKCNYFITNDKKLLRLSNFYNINIVSPKNRGDL